RNEWRISTLHQTVLIMPINGPESAFCFGSVYGLVDRCSRRAPRYNQHGPSPQRRNMTVLLSVQGLSKSFGPRPLFHDLSLDLRAGERIGLIGPNGSGKSVLLRLLSGREDADAGTRSLRRSARLGHVAQDDQFAPGLTVREVVLATLG